MNMHRVPVITTDLHGSPQCTADMSSTSVDTFTAIDASTVFVASVDANTDVFDDNSLTLWIDEAEELMPDHVMQELQDTPSKLMLPDTAELSHQRHQQSSTGECTLSLDDSLLDASSLYRGNNAFDRPHLPSSTVDSQTISYSSRGVVMGDDGGRNHASRWTSWEQLGQALTSSALSDSDMLRDRRRRNRISMQRYRQRKQGKIQQMQATVAQLEKQYEALCLHSNYKADGEDAVTVAGDSQSSPSQMAMLMRRLRVENAMLSIAIPDYDPWKERLSQIVHSMPYLKNTSPNDGSAIEILESHEAELIYQFRPVDGEFVKDRILDNTHIVQQIHHQLDQGDFDDHIQILGWNARRRLVGTETHYLFSKRFTCGLSAYNMLERTWWHFQRFEHVKKVETDTLRLDLLQEINSDAILLGRDVRSSDDQTIFRTMFLRYKMETTMEWTNPANPSGPKLCGHGYTQGVHSMNPERSSHLVPFGVEDGKKLQWADMMFAIHFLNIIDPTTHEPAIEVRWVGKSNYKTEPLANRNNLDTVTTILRWELLVVAPALNLVSLSLLSNDSDTTV